MAVINRTQFKNVKLYYLNLKELNKFGKYSLIVGGLSEGDCKFFVGSRKTVKKDVKFGGNYIQFAVKPESRERLIFVDARNKAIPFDTVVGNGSTANVAVAMFQNSMGTFPILNGIQVTNLVPYGQSTSMFEPVASASEENENDSPFADQGDIDD